MALPQFHDNRKTNTSDWEPVYLDKNKDNKMPSKRKKRNIYQNANESSIESFLSEKQKDDNISQMSREIDKKIIEDLLKMKEDSMSKHFDYIISKANRIEADVIIAYLIELSKKLNKNTEKFCLDFKNHWENKMK